MPLTVSALPPPVPNVAAANEEGAGPSGLAWWDPHHLHITGEFMNYAATTARPEESAATCKC